MSPMELAQYEQNVRRQMYAARDEACSELPMLRVLEEVATEWSFRAAERVVPDDR
jgi:hypothetical protein